MEKKAVSPIVGIAHRPWRGTMTLDQRARAALPAEDSGAITPHCAFCAASGPPGTVEAGREWFARHECWSSR